MRTWIRSGLVLALFLIFVGHAAGWLRWGLLAQLEFFAYDVQVRADARGNAVDRRVVVLDIDEPSLAREGQWPWPRARLAEIVERLYRDYGVFTIGFDIVFAEPGRGTGDGVFEALRRSELGQQPLAAVLLTELQSQLGGDARFAQALGQGRSVMGFVLKGELDDPLQIGALPESDLPDTRMRDNLLPLPDSDTLLCWAGTGEPELPEALRSGKQLVLRAGGSASLADDNEALRRIAEHLKNRSKAVILLVRCWQPPTGELQDFLETARDIWPSGTRVALVPLAADINHEPGAHQIQPWLRFAERVGSEFVQVSLPPFQMRDPYSAVGEPL